VTIDSASTAVPHAKRGVGHVVSELGLLLDRTGDPTHGRAEVLPEACVPGTDVLRTSVIATWADVVTGGCAGRAISPVIPLTLDLEVQIVAPIRIGTMVDVDSEAVKVGKRVVMTSAHFRDLATGELLAVAFASFMPSSNPADVFPDGFPTDFPVGRLAVPLAERVASVAVAPGVVEVPHRPDALNGVGAIQGGVLAFSAEQAAASLADGPVLAESLVIRYLRPFMVGPARAVATGDGALSVVHVTDSGSGKLGLTATVRNRPL
jgi:acyl-coenzyme A thioesterase PaaI-like protein